MTPASERERLDEVEREVKWWLRGCVLAPGLATTLRWLNMAYEAQGGLALRADFRRVVQERCPGLRTVERRGRVVVLGVAPRWSREQLLRAAARDACNADLVDFLDGKE